MNLSSLSGEVSPVDVCGHGGEEHGEEVGGPAALLLPSRRARGRRGGPTLGAFVLVAHAVVLEVQTFLTKFCDAFWRGFPEHIPHICVLT